MSDSAESLLAREWRSSILLYSEAVRATVKNVALKNTQVLAAFFYEQMLQDQAAKLFLSHETVHSRLMPSMQNWINQLFSVDVQADFVALVELQKKVGEVHARIDLPVHLVLHGARTIKNKFSDLLEELDGVCVEHRKEAFKLVSDSLDIAMEVMSRAYASNSDRKSRAEESYRLFSAVHNAAAEKGRQRSALLDWENQLMFDLAVGTAVSNLLNIKKSDFGLWFIHKGLHAFDNLSEAKIIMESIERIDEMMPNLEDVADRIELLKKIRSEARNIQINVDALFDKYNELEAGRDELTRLLSRKYLSVVLSKEVNYARKRDIAFALIAIDLDFFKRINDTYGHEAGDAVLQQFSELLSNRSRAGDYVFRLGGEEFLILLVDVNKETAIRVAKQINQKIREEKFFIPSGDLLKVTASLGVTLFDGHPDYSKLLSRADKALYQAKEKGRDQVVYLES
ncbi:diguanylate cyclase [uncultured Paenalcaligenes sp.]|uniref:diguanylate cyclase n=1 Tax=uncultured Paenalcaligenes sp. TaxID=1588925 RepID=UPI00261DD5DB|nr:diguanylate cyclase [uncultured Paenalcaligenes sp.]